MESLRSAIERLASLEVESNPDARQIFMDFRDELTQGKIRAAEKIEGQVKGSVAVERAGTIERAVEIAARIAHSGDIVLLAPACASFDQFENYEQRGRIFKELVRELQADTAASAKQSPATSSSSRQ